MLQPQLPNVGATQALAIDDTSGGIAYSAVTDAGPTQVYAYNPDTTLYEFRQNLTNNVYSVDWSSNGSRLFLGHANVLEIYEYSDANKKY